MTGADIYMKTCKEKALEWNVSPRSVMICAKRKNTGCNKRKGSWLIPDDSPKPMDGRVSNGKYIKKIWLRKQKLNHYQSASLTMFVRRKNITMSTRRY